ncbi:MAG: secretion protein HlyD [Verrucomicrobiales bacterium]|nr:secretion protein HlyD [Verrucomicrobiales bacterium]
MDQPPKSTIRLDAPRNPDHQKRAGRWPWVLAGLIIAAGIGAFFLHRQKPKTQPTGGKPGGGAPTLMVSTAVARKGDIGVFVNALGVVTPVNTVAVKSRVDGQIVKINYEEGQLVHQGDSLLEIDSGPYRAALTQAEGQFARDSALLENAKLDLDRYKEALAKNAIPKQQLDTQMSAVHQYEGAVKLDEGQIENAKVQLAYCHIVAPITGRVGLRQVDAGNIIHANDTSPLVVITQLQPITVVFSVAEDNLPQIQQQMRQAKKLAVNAFDRAQLKKIAMGALQTMDNQIDTTTGTVKLKALFPNEDESLFPNQFVNAQLLVDTHHDVTLVPNPVLQRNAQGPFVYLLKPDQTVTVNPVALGTTDGIVSEVKGLEPGALVVSDNFNRLNDGMKVTVRPASNPNDASKKKGPH